MPFEHPQPVDDDGRVIELRSWVRRSRARQDRRPPPSKPALDTSPVRDLTAYERGGREDDYRHRMIVNAIAATFITLLVAAGLWLTGVLAHS